MREMYGIPLEVDDFITRPEPCGNPNLFLPFPTIPIYLMDSQKAVEAQVLLDKCTSMVGSWGEKKSKKDTEEFQNASSAFKDITGIDAWEIISEAMSRFNDLMASRMGI